MVYASIVKVPVISRFNIIYVIIFAFFLVINKRYVCSWKSMLLTILICHSFFVNLFTENTLAQILGGFILNYIPIYILCMKNKVLDSIIPVITRLIKIFNIVMVLVVTRFILDIFLNDAIIQLEARIFSQVNEVYNAYQSYGRLTSLMGNQMTCGQLFLYFYVMNEFYALKFHKRLFSYPLTLLVALVGVAATASRGAIILLFIAIVYFNSKGKNVSLKITLTVGILSIALGMGIFSNLFGRFVNEQSFTSGRLETVIYIFSHKLVDIKIFSGYGHNSMDSLAQYFGDIFGDYSGRTFYTAMEFPFFSYIVQYGVFNAAMTWFLLWGQFSLLKSWEIFVSITIIFAYANCNTGLWSGRCVLPLYCIVVLILLAIEKGAYINDSKKNILCDC